MAKNYARCNRIASLALTIAMICSLLVPIGTARASELPVNIEETQQLLQTDGETPEMPGTPGVVLPPEGGWQSGGGQNIGMVSGSANVEFGTLEGYERSSSKVAIYHAEDGYLLPNGVSYSNNLSSVTLNTYDDHEVQLTLDFTSLQNPSEKVTYIDKKILKGWEINQLSNWEVHANYPQLTIAPELRAAGGNFYINLATSNGDYKLLNYRNTLYPNDDTKLMFAPGKHRFSWVNANEKIFLYRDLMIAESQSIDFQQAKAEAVELTVDAYSNVALVGAWYVDPLGSNQVSLNDTFSTEQGGSQYTVTKGSYAISFNQKIPLADGKFGIGTWRNNNLDILSPHSIGKQQPEDTVMNIDKQLLEYNYLWGQVNIMSGRYSLTGYREVGLGMESGDLSLYKGDQLVQSWKLSSWYNFFFYLNKRLPDGKYELRFSLNYAGQEIKQSYSFQIGNRDEELNGYVVTAKDQAGKPLMNAKLRLYELMSSPENISSKLKYAPIFKDTVKDGEVFIPNTYLLHGKDYALLVEGTDQEGNSVVYQRQFTMSDTPPLQLTGDQLKSINLNHSLADVSGTLVFNMTDTEIFNTSISMNSNSRTLWLSSNVKTDVIADLSDSKKETRYYLRHTIDAASPATIKLDQGTIELAPPERFSKEDVGVNLDQGGSTAKYYKKLFITASNQDIGVWWYLSKNGYTYHFYKYFNPVEDKLTLDIPNEVEGYAENLSGELTIFYRGNSGMNNFSSVEATNVAPKPVYTFELSDAGGKVIGEPIVTDKIQLYLPLHNLKNGQYRIKLLHTNVPKDVIQLKLDTTFDVGQYTRKTLPIELPKGMTSVNINESYASFSELIRQSDGTYKKENIQHRTSIQGNKIDLYYTKDANTLYQLYVYISENSSTKYVRKLILSGEQLDKLTSLPVSGNKGSMQITLPQTSRTGTLFVDSLYDNSSSVDGFMITPDSSTSTVKILGDIEQTRVQYMDANSETILSLQQIVPKGKDDLAIDLNQLKATAVPVHFEREDGKQTQLAAVGVDNAGIETSHLFGRWSEGDQQTVSRLLVNSGDYKFTLVTLDKRANETPWLSAWSTNRSYPVQKETTLKFSDKLDKQEITKLSFDYPYGTDWYGAVRAQVTIGNNDWTLAQVYNVREREQPYMMKMETLQEQRPYVGVFDLLQSVKAAINIKDEAGNVVKQTVAADQVSSLEIPYLRLAKGNYSLEWNQPIAPLKSVTLKKTFTVSDKPVDPVDPEKPTVPTGGGGFFGVPTNKNLKTIDEKALKLQSDGTYQVDATDAEQTEVLLTSEALKKLEKASLHIVTPFGTVQLDAAAVQEWAKQNNNGQLVLRFAYPTVEEQQAIAGEAGKSKRTEVKPAGDAVEIQLLSRSSDDKDTPAKAPTGMKVTLKAVKDADTALIGLYKWNVDGTLTYVGGKVRDGQVEAALLESGKYSVFSYEKTFADVPNWHWAEKFITELSAKHLIQGIDTNKFAPERAINRAEFATLLVRMLDLKSVNTDSQANSMYKDVAKEAWYADEITAAVEHGLVKGVSEDQFQPSRAITRAELAVMLDRVLAYLKLKSAEPAANVSFSDANAIAEWARDAAQVVYGLDLIQQSKDNKFDGNKAATRAEAAKAMHGLLQLLNK